MEIFLVTKDAAQQMWLAELLHQGESRTLTELSDAAQVLARIEQGPDFIITDMDLPDMDGLELCRRWREACAEPTQIILIGTERSMEMRLRAYDAGVTNYLVKPLQPDVLLHKVEAAEHILRQHSELAEQVQNATQMAFTAMSTIGEMGITQQFMQASFNASSVSDLVNAVMEGLRGYGLLGLVEVRLGGLAKQFSSEAASVTEMEVSLLSNASVLGRIFQLSNRMVINYPAITVLMSNLPVDDPEKLGRLRDHLAILCEGANTRLKALEIEQINQAKTLGIAQVVARLSEVLDRIRANEACNQQAIHRINAEFLAALIEAFIPMGLSSRQENIIIEIAKQTQAELESLRDLDQDINQQLVMITEELNNLMGISEAV